MSEIPSGNPYSQSTMGAQPAPMGMPMMRQPGAIQVFGILHIVFSGLMILGAVWTVVQSILQQRASSWQMNLSTGDDEFEVWMMSFQSSTLWYSVSTSVISLAVSVVMLMAGIKLVKGALNAVKWSNLYAWLSIGEKVLVMVLMGVFLGPMMNRMMEEVGPEFGQAAGVFRAFFVVGMVLYALLGSIYPVLALIFLNRPVVKAWYSIRAGMRGAPL